MSLTVESITDRVSGRTRATTASALATYMEFLQETLDIVFAARKWSWSFYRGDFTVPDPYTTGTISGSDGSTALTGASTVWTGISGYATGTFYIDVGGKMRKIATIDSNTGITLKAALDEDVAALSTYTLYSPVVELDVEINGPLQITSKPYGALRLMSPAEAEEEWQNYPANDPAEAACFLPPGPTSRGSRIILYPYPSSARTYAYYGKRKAPRLSATTDDLVVPDEFIGMLTEGVLERWYSEKDERFDKAQYHGGKFAESLALHIAADPSFNDTEAIVSGWDWGGPAGDYGMGGNGGNPTWWGA